METALKRPKAQERFFSANGFKPPLVKIIRKYKADKRAGTPTKLWREIGAWALQVAASLAINRATARYAGVGAWDPKLQGAGRMVTDASPLSMTVSTAIAHSIPPHYAHPLQAAEYATCVIRICAEQWAWKRVGMTGDPAGPILSPFTAGVLEMAYKATETQPADEPARLLVAVNGMFGNAVRMVEAGLLVLAHYLYRKHWPASGQQADDAPSGQSGK